MLSVNILGSCLVRDAFDFVPFLKKYNIIKFLQNNPPTSLGFSRLSELGITFSSEDFKNTPPVWYRWFQANAEESVFSILKENMSDYIIVNPVESYYPMYDISIGNRTARLCFSKGIKENGILDKLSKYKFQTVDPMALSEKEINDLIDKFCNELSSIYDEDKILIVANYPAYYYISIEKENSVIHSFDTLETSKQIDFLDKIYLRLYSNLKSSHIIKFPKNCLADVNHFWGLTPLHYTKDFYQYLAARIDMILTETDKLIVSDMLYHGFENSNDLMIARKSNISKNKFLPFLIQYVTLRVCLKLISSSRDTFDFSDFSSHYILSQPPWLQKGGYGAMLLMDSGEVSFSVKFRGHGRMILYIQGIDARDGDDQRYPVYIDLQKLYVNESLIVDRKITVWHDNPYIYEQTIECDQIVRIGIEWTPYNFRS